MAKVEIQIYYKSRVGMAVNLALCIECAHGWDCRLKLSVFVDYRKLLLLQKCSSSAAYPTCWLYEDVDIEAVDDKRELGADVTGIVLSRSGWWSHQVSYLHTPEKRYSSLSSIQPMWRSSVLKVTEPVIVYITALTLY